MLRLSPRKSRGLKRKRYWTFWKTGFWMLFITISVLATAQVCGAILRLSEPVVIHDTQIIQKEVIKEVEVIRYINSTPKRALQAKPGGNMEQWRPLVEKYFGSQADNALRVMACESGGNPNSVSKTRDYGLMQINAPTWCKFFGVSAEQLKDPETNIKLAYVIYQRGGWKPWVCSRKVLN